MVVECVFVVEFDLGGGVVGGVCGEGCCRRREDGEWEDVGVFVVDVLWYEVIWWCGGICCCFDVGIGDIDLS